jgi:hypothetical protein
MSSFTLYPTSALELRPVHQNQEKIVVSKEDVEDITESVVPQRDDRQPEYLTGTRFWVIVAVYDYFSKDASTDANHLPVWQSHFSSPT